MKIGRPDPENSAKFMLDSNPSTSGTKNKAVSHISRTKGCSPVATTIATLAIVIILAAGATFFALGFAGNFVQGLNSVSQFLGPIFGNKIVSGPLALGFGATGVLALSQLCYSSKSNSKVSRGKASDSKAKPLKDHNLKLESSGVGSQQKADHKRVKNRPTSTPPQQKLEPTSEKPRITLDAIKQVQLKKVTTLDPKKEISQEATTPKVKEKASPPTQEIAPIKAPDKVEEEQPVHPVKLAKEESFKEPKLLAAPPSPPASPDTATFNIEKWSGVKQKQTSPLDSKTMMFLKVTLGNEITIEGQEEKVFSLTSNKAKKGIAAKPPSSQQLEPAQEIAPPPAPPPPSPQVATGTSTPSDMLKQVQLKSVQPSPRKENNEPPRLFRRDTMIQRAQDKTTAENEENQGNWSDEESSSSTKRQPSLRKLPRKGSSKKPLNTPQTLENKRPSSSQLPKMIPPSNTPENKIKKASPLLFTQSVLNLFGTRRNAVKEEDSEGSSVD